MAAVTAYLNPLNPAVSKTRIILLLAWPAIVEQILQTLVNYVDTAMVGALGVNEAAAVSVNVPLTWLINGVNLSVSTGFSVLAARAVGRGEAEAVKEIIRQAVIGIFVIGISMSLLACMLIAPNYARLMGVEAEILNDSIAYLRIITAGQLFQLMLAVTSAIVRGLGNTKTPMLYNACLNVINVALNFLLIYPSRTIVLFGRKLPLPGAGMGVRGAAWASLLAAVFAGVLMLSALFRKKNPYSIHVSDRFRVNPAIMRQMGRLSFPLLLERVLLNSGQILVSSLAAGMGTAALAAHQLANTAESICYLPANGFGVAATTLVAQAAGAGKEELANLYTKKCLCYNILVMCVMATAMFVFAPQLMGLFIEEQSVIQTGALLLRVEALVEPCLAINNVLTGVMKARGKTIWPFLIALLGMWLIRVPMSFAAVKLLQGGLVALWIVMGLDWIVRTLACFWCSRRISAQARR